MSARLIDGTIVDPKPPWADVIDRVGEPGPGLNWLGPAVDEGDPGHLDLTRNIARCTACDWEGVPTFVDGVPQLSCPACQTPGEKWFGKHDEDGIDLHGFRRRRKVKIDRHGNRKGEIPKTRIGALVKVRADVEKIPRNAPCPCGSGLKYKKCHGR
jgi:hypothetical protein